MKAWIKWHEYLQHYRLHYAPQVANLLLEFDTGFCPDCCLIIDEDYPPVYHPDYDEWVVAVRQICTCNFMVSETRKFMLTRHLSLEPIENLWDIA